MLGELRLFRLSMIARLRAAGTVPWLLSFAWLAVASLQEPLLLRRFGIALLDDAAWVGGMLLLVALLLADAPQPRNRAWLTSIATLVLVACVQQVGVVLLDRGPPVQWMHRRLSEAGLFVLAWSPLSLTLPVGTIRGSPGPKSAWLVASLAMLAGAAVSVALRSEADGAVIAAALAASAAATCSNRHKPL